MSYRSGCLYLNDVLSFWVSRSLRLGVPCQDRMGIAQGHTINTSIDITIDIYIYIDINYLMFVCFLIFFVYFFKKRKRRHNLGIDYYYYYYFLFLTSTHKHTYSSASGKEILNWLTDVIYHREHFQLLID